MHPFARQVDVTDRILQKTDEAFRDSMVKAEGTRDQIRERTAETAETQKRILNE